MPHRPSSVEPVLPAAAAVNQISSLEWHAGFRGQAKPVAREKDREKELEKEREKERERERDKADAGSESSHELAHHPKTERAKW